MKKHTSKASARLIALTSTFVLCAVFALAACSPSTELAGESESAAVEYSEGSVIAYHEALGKDTSTFTEVSWSTCATEAACHGSMDEVIEETEDMFEGTGQIPAANPHFAHASNAFECSDCHSLTSASTLMCNECHNFELPSEWVGKDPRTTIYGHSESAPYTGDGLVDALSAE